MNKILDELPQCYRNKGEQEEIAGALTSEISNYLSSLDSKLINYETNYLNPLTCQESWLDTLAAWAGWGRLWDSGWAPDIKRQLLVNTDFLWSNRGNREGLSKLFEIFGLSAQLQPSTGFILRVSTFPSKLGSDPFDWQIKIPVGYSAGTPERVLVEKLAHDFLPCWLSLLFVN